MSSENTQNSFSIRFVLMEDKLDGSNFYDWYRNLRIVLKQEGKDYVLRRPLPEKLSTNASHAVYNAWDKHYTDMVDVRSLILATMSSDLREQYEKLESPIEIITNLIHRFQVQTRVEKFETVKSLIRCKLQEGNPVSRHVNMMIGYFNYLDKLDYPISDKMASMIILQSLPSSFGKFVRNYVKKGLTKTLTELHGMLKTAELDIEKGTRNVLAVQKGNGFKKPANDKGRNKAIQISDQGGFMYSMKPKSGPSNKCSYCKEQGHLVTNCNKFLEDLNLVTMKY